MRSLPAKLQAILDGGVEQGMGIGDKKAITRITVQPDWWLNTSSGPVGNRRADKLPIRWYQAAANNQTEIEIPNLKQVIIDRSLTEDAGTIQATFYNTKTPNLGAVGDQSDAFGEPGYLSWARGASYDAKQRWGQQPNEWSNILRENALLRVYQGYGPNDLTLPELINQGYVILNGVFLVDNVAIDAHTGFGTLNGRDMAKLLIEQFVWPPLVPQSFYGYTGIQYFVTGQNYNPPVPGYGIGAYVTRRCAFDSASTAGPVDGHNVTDCLDGDPNNYYLSEGFNSPSGTPWIQFDTQEEVSSVFVLPYGGNFTCYVSIMENGRWVSGEGDINGVPYVIQFGLPENVGLWHDLARIYKANKVRLSFSNLEATRYIPAYRAGLRTVQLGGSNKVTQVDKEVTGIDITPTGAGYWVCGTDGKVYPFGDAFSYGDMAGHALNGAIVGMAATPTGLGYWLVGADGGVFTFGDAKFHGSTGNITINQPAIGIQATPSGKGYWLAAADGGVFAFGDATFYGSQTTLGDGTGIISFATRPQGDGYWQMTNSGDVYTFGNAPYHGGLSSLTPNPLNSGKVAAAIGSDATGNGYWIATTDGTVYTFGDAPTYGSENHVLNSPITGMRRTHDGLGYYLAANDGGVFTFGDAQFWGALPGPSIVPGTYKDYSDIVEDMCLWAGFWYYPGTAGTPAGQPPAVFGNIEKTGAWNSVGPLDPSTTDKQQLIDVIKMIRDTVGYIFRVDETGAVRFECVDDSTEAFTRRGWVKHNELLPDDEFYSLNPDTNLGEWVKALTVNSYDVVDEKLISMESRQHSSLTTPNHRWWTTRRERTGRSRWETSDSLVWESRIPISAPVDTPDGPYSDSFVELVGWWFSGGHDRGDSAYICQSISANLPKVDRIRELLLTEYGERGMSIRSAAGDPALIEEALASVAAGTSLTKAAARLGLDRHTLARYRKQLPEGADWAETYTHSDAGYSASLGRDTPESDMVYFRLGKHPKNMLRSVAPDRTPTREFLCSLSPRQLELFIAGALLGDGNESSVTRGGLTWGGYRRLTQKSAKQVESFQYACTLAGHATSVKVRNDSLGGTIHTVQVLRVTATMPVAAASHPNGVATIKRVSYTGTVWCPTLERNQIWLARRNGKMYFTGNSPNYWTSGNFLDDGTPTKSWPVLDEKLNLTDYIQTTSDQTLRSEIIVAAADPYKFGGAPGGITVTRFVPPNIGSLHGIVKPAMIGVPLNVPITTQDQELMAEFLALQSFFANRQGQVTAAAHLAICPNDQVRIFERITGEANIHYVQGVHTEHDLDSGQFLATYTTYWLGNSDTWSITTATSSVSQQLGGTGSLTSETFPLSSSLINFLNLSPAASTQGLPTTLNTVHAD